MPTPPPLHSRVVAIASERRSWSRSDGLLRRSSPCQRWWSWWVVKWVLWVMWVVASPTPRNRMMRGGAWWSEAWDEMWWVGAVECWLAAAVYSVEAGDEATQRFVASPPLPSPSPRPPPFFPVRVRSLCPASLSSGLQKPACQVQVRGAVWRRSLPACGVGHEIGWVECVFIILFMFVWIM